MPPLSFIKPLGQLKFFSHSLKLGTEWDSKYSIKDEAEQVNKGDKKAVPELIPPWFMPAETPSKLHQKSCDDIGKEFKDFHDAMIDAVGFAHNMWKLKAKFKDLQVASVSAIGSPGCLDGDELESGIKNAPMCASFTGNKKKHRDAVAKGVSKAFKNWQDQVSVPGLPWYPAFAAFPGPMAPPMPNLPTPFISTFVGSPSEMMASALKSAMVDALGDSDALHHAALFDAIGTAINACWVIWTASTVVTGVMGKGPIPTFAPPIVPVGPVLGGSTLPTPGHFV